MAFLLKKGQELQRLQQIQELQRLAYDRSDAVRKAVAQNPATPQPALSYLADDENWNMRWAVARRTNDPAVLAKLADDEIFDVRVEVAKRTNDPAVLAKLADDKYWLVRSHVSERTNDPAVLAKLADDEDWTVRSHVAKRTSDPEILAKLADDKDWLVRVEVAKRTSDPEILAKLADDKNESVRRAARNQLEISLSLENPLPKKSRPKKPTQTGWSIPIYELQNYSDIEREIDQVISDAVTSAMTEVYPDKEFSFETTANSYDEDGQLIIQVAGETLTYDLQTLLPMATFSQKKKDCIKKLADYIVKNI